MIENEVECISRKYRVKLPNGTTMEIESRKPLDKRETAMLLKNDSELCEFLKHYTITGILHQVPQKKEEKEEKQKETIMAKDGKLSPQRRLFFMTQMQGEFTRLDYMKYMENIVGCRISDYMAHGDIEEAIKKKKIEKVGKRDKYMTYKVIEIEKEDESLSQQLLEGRKVHIGTIQ